MGKSNKKGQDCANPQGIKGPHKVKKNWRFISPNLVVQLQAEFPQLLVTAGTLVCLNCNINLYRLIKKKRAGPESSESDTDDPNDSEEEVGAAAGFVNNLGIGKKKLEPLKAGDKANIKPTANKKRKLE